MESSTLGEDHHLFRVYKAHMSEVRLVLFQVLSWGCPKVATQTFDQYLVASGVSHTSYRKNFSRHQREKISVNPSGDRFDISLLYKMIQLACHSLAPPGDAAWATPDDTCLEYLLTHLKNSRNGLVHDMPTITKEEMVQQIETLRDLLARVVKASGALYCINVRTVEEVLRRINFNLTNIRDQPFAPLDLEDYRSNLLFDSLRETLRLDGAKELKKIYSSKIFLDPLSFLDKSECHLRVGTVFISLLIQDIRTNAHCHRVHYQELLEYCDAATPESSEVESDEEGKDETQKFPMMVLEGQPGSGKTTLLRLYMSEWIAGGGDIRGLSDFDLVLHFECRDPSIDSLTQLLLSHMPQTTTRFRKTDILQIFLSLKVMILVDGLDELNSASLKVLKEIMYWKSSSDLTLICTTRAEQIREVYRLASDKVRVVHLKLQGIPVEKREEFVRVYHSRLKQRGVPQQDLSGLLEYLRSVPSHLQDFFRFPLNLVLLTFLWDSAKARITRITSMTALYLETHKLLIEKLLERLMYHPSTEHLSLTKVTRKCDSFLAVMYEEALRALSAGVVYLDKAATKRLREHCLSQSLPTEEMFSAFLVSVSYDSTLAHAKELSFPHKGIQDFYAARHVTLHLVRGHFPGLTRFLQELENLMAKSSVPAFPRRQVMKHARQLLDKPITIRNVLLEFHQDQYESPDLGRYQNVICHLVSLLHGSGRDEMGHSVAEQHAEEVVSLLAAEKGMSFEDWVDVLKEANYNSVFAGEISKVLPKFSWTVRDKHVEAAAAFLSHQSPTQFTIDIMGDPEKVPRLHDLLEIAAASGCKVSLYLHHHWRHPGAGLSNPFLQLLVPARPSNARASLLSSSTNSQDDDDCYAEVPLRSPGPSVRRLPIGTPPSSEPKICLVEVMGRFSGPAVLNLPSSLKELKLALADDNDALDWFRELMMLTQTLPFLQCIWLHVAANVTPDLLPNLPQLRYRPRLYLSSVGDGSISWASRVARALLPPSSKYANLVLAGSSLSSRGVNQLVARLHHLAVGVYGGRGGGLVVASSNLADDDLSNVRTSVFRHLSCPFSRVHGEEIWFDESMYEQVYDYSAPPSSALRDSLGSEEIYLPCRTPPEAKYINLNKKLQASYIQEESGYVNVQCANEERVDESLDKEDSIYSDVSSDFQAGFMIEESKSSSEEGPPYIGMIRDEKKKIPKQQPSTSATPPQLPGRKYTLARPPLPPASSPPREHSKLCSSSPPAVNHLPKPFLPPKPPLSRPPLRQRKPSIPHPLQLPDPNLPQKPPPPPPPLTSRMPLSKTHTQNPSRPAMPPPHRSNKPRPVSDPSTPGYSAPSAINTRRKCSYFSYPSRGTHLNPQHDTQLPHKPAIPLPLSPRLPKHRDLQQESDLPSPSHSSQTPPQSPLTSLFDPANAFEQP
ncbi:uncharacterized protein LOC127005811 isoform X1 [Eriocheir sinensis]|uniref:uncharacterized protein LOC127005811 isoform X1 n=1 Tax=Eriocheir sinensis TaxID=95602 RepID=UPI0021C669CF|nr:uncharacterized protein LOC127005811 isoform X1 [Eriocheir sinensis]